jgi:copper oxidase (laccase) domain-containing protein
MMIINPYIFKQLPEITFGFSTKLGLNRKAPYYFNMSYTVGDDSGNVDENREAFFKQLGLSIDSVAYQKQVHGDKINVVKSGRDCGESDAMITTEKGIGIAISTADCCAIFIFDPVKKIIAGAHSGWRGTSKRILSKVLKVLFDEYCSKPENLICLN